MCAFRMYEDEVSGRLTNTLVHMKDQRPEDAPIDLAEAVRSGHTSRLVVGRPRESLRG